MPNLRAITIPISSGSEPELIEIDDVKEAIGIEPERDDTDEFGDVIELFFLSPSGHCEYSMADGFARRIHCKRKSGL